MTIFNQTDVWNETETEHLAKLINYIFQAIGRGHDPRNEIFGMAQYVQYTSI